MPNAEHQKDIQENQSVTLDDLIPEHATFTLKSTGKIYIIRPVNLDDQVWVKKNIGDETMIEKAFSGLDPDVITKLVYRLMDQDGRTDFMARDCSEINGDGEQQSYRLTGPQALCKAIEWPQEFIEVFRALLKTIGISNPILDKLGMDIIKKKETNKA
jgi:hypothetical protein